MTFLFADSFETVTTHPQLANRGWVVTSSPLISTVIFKDGTQCVSNQGDENIQLPITASDTVFASFWFYKAHELQRIFFRFMGATTGQLYLETQTDDTYKIKDQAATDLGTSAAHASDTWHHIEFKGRFNNSITLGDVQLKVNGIQEINVTGGTDTQDSTDSTIQTIELESGVTGRIYFDSPIFWNDLAGDDWNDFRGQLHIETKAPNANGPDSAWVGSDADSTDNYLHVDEIEAIHDGDVSYSAGSAFDSQDSYNFPAMIADSEGEILGVQVLMVAKKTLAFNKTITPFFVDGGPEFSGAKIALTNGTYTTDTHMFDENPATAAQWTHAVIDTGNFGQRVTA